MNKKKVIITLAIVAVALIAAQSYLSKGKKAGIAEDASVEAKKASSQPLPPNNRLAYANSKYGFELKFPQSWANYKAVETNDIIFKQVAYIEFALPTSDSKYYSMAGKGQITVFTIGIYPISEWQKAQSGEYGPKPVLLGQNSTNYFGYYTSTIKTTDTQFTKKDLQIQEVIQSFKIK